MKEEASGGLPDLSTMLSKVMENPQAVSMLSSLLGGVSKPSADDEKCASCPPPPLPPAEMSRKSASENRRRLLLALKPYLSAERCRIIDRILMLTEALSLLEKKGGGQ